MKVVQTIMFAEYPTVTVIPSFEEAIEIEETGQHYCSYCGVNETPFYDIDSDEWLMPCHNIPCDDCGTVYNTDELYWQQAHSAYHCSSCYIPRPEPRPRSSCDCNDCRPRSKSNITPGWVKRGVTVPEIKVKGIKKWIQKQASTIDPTKMMAQFYAADYVMAITGRQIGNGANRRNVAYRDSLKLYSDAKACQDYVVAQCDGIFRDYLLAAIGGECRHYPGIDMPNGRSSAWDWFVAAAMQTNRVDMIKDCVEIFEDKDNWGGGFGGEAWRKIADILLARETGKLDAKTFVDRVFTLQHNGGSALNKVSWKAYLNCETVGNAHAAEVIDFSTIFNYCGNDFVSALFVTEEGYLRLNTYGVAKEESINLLNAVVGHSNIAELNSDVRASYPHNSYTAQWFDCPCDVCVLTNDANKAAKKAKEEAESAAYWARYNDKYENKWGDQAYKVDKEYGVWNPYTGPKGIDMGTGYDANGHCVKPGCSCGK